MEKKKLAKLQKSLTEYLDELLNSSFDGLVISDPEANVIKVNKAYLELSGLDSQEIVEHNLKDLINGGILKGAVVFEVTKTHVPTTMMHKYPRTGKIAMVTGNPVFDKDGNLIYIIANFRDITRLSRLSKELGYPSIASIPKETIYIKSELADLPHFGILVHNKKMKECLELAVRVAQFDSHVLILGESGVGKTKLAEIIHKASPRSRKPFISINCGSIPENLLESELFGYVKGAFTGASTKGKSGMFEAASGGTIVLEEIGDLSLNLQVKLLQAIEAKRIFKIGSTIPVDIDARIIATTNQNLRVMVSQNKFREDLYFRLNVIPIIIPALRERRDEIPLFIKYFFDQFNRQYGTHKFPSSAVIEILSQHEFPGNVRELRNLIDRLAIMSQDDYVDSEYLKGLSFESEQEFKIPKYKENFTLQHILEKCERTIISRILKEEYSYKQASKRLGISNATLWRKMTKYGLIKKKMIEHIAEDHGIIPL